MCQLQRTPTKTSGYFKRKNGVLANDAVSSQGEGLRNRELSSSKVKTEPLHHILKTFWLLHG